MLITILCLQAIMEIIEIQGTAEKRPLPWNIFEQLRVLAISGIDTIFATTQLYPVPLLNKEPITSQVKNNNQKPPLFSLKNRITVS